MKLHGNPHFTVEKCFMLHYSILAKKKKKLYTCKFYVARITVHGCKGWLERFLVGKGFVSSALPRCVLYTTMRSPRSYIIYNLMKSVVIHTTISSVRVIY